MESAEQSSNMANLVLIRGVADAVQTRLRQTQGSQTEFSLLCISIDATTLNDPN